MTSSTPSRSTDFPLTVTDHLGREVRLTEPPRRVVSLVPSITRTLFDLGLADHVAGRTKFCVQPEGKVDAVPVVGGTKQFHADRIRAIGPDLILANKEENEASAVRDLMDDFTVFVTDVRDLQGNERLLRDLGALTGTREMAARITEDTRRAFATVRPLPGIPAAYLIWKDPYMAAGGDTFINAMLAAFGLNNVFAGRPGRYPEVSAGELAASGAKVVLLSSEPYPFTEKHSAEFRALCPDALVLPIDGAAFSWYGSLVAGTPAYFSQLELALKLNAL